MNALTQGGAHEAATQAARVSRYNAGTHQAVARAKAGDRHAVRFLYTTYYTSVLRYADSLLRDTDAAQDVAQTTFLKLLTKIHLYEPREVPFEAWLLRVTRNVALDELRRRRARPATELLDHDHATVDTIANRFGTVQAALDRVPEAEREVLVLRYVAGFSWEEIAERTGSTESTVRMLHSRARTELRAALRRGEWDRTPGGNSASHGSGDGIHIRRFAHSAPAGRVAVEVLT